MEFQNFGYSSGRWRFKGKQSFPVERGEYDLSPDTNRTKNAVKEPPCLEISGRVASA